MSCLGSTRTNFSTSQMSLASSALMSALSTSDADYETSDEQLLSPQVLDEADVARGSSNLRWSSSLLSSQSVSCLVDGCTSEDFVTTSSDADKYAMTVKSDTCLSQQSKIISDFINDMRLQEQQQQQQQQSDERDSSSAAAAALSNKHSATSVQTEFFPANASDSPYDSILDLNIDDDSADTISEKEEIADDAGIEYSYEEYPADEEKLSPQSDGKETVRSTLSETRHKILENLAQVTSDKLFSKAPGARHRFVDSGCSSMTKSRCLAAANAATAMEPAQTVRRVTSRRPFQRCRGVESLLQIDYELQPLNLMLSRLLAEFRAMDLRGKLGYVDAAPAPSHDQNNNALSDDSLKRENYTFKDVPSRLLRKEEEDDTCVKFLCSLSHEYLNDNPAKSSSSSSGKEANGIAIAAAQISRSCEDNCLLSRDSYAKGTSRRGTKSGGKHLECSNETAERNPRCHRDETRCCTAAAAVDDDPQKATSEEDQFGSGVFHLMGIASTN